ncbi:Hsp33 family molecular chaperone HslO [Erythrobacter sp. HL-111]|uniref:Hsp33 family molecular chaperone HslO n=1 Tax=Erythrobacter sp. HL-111 TaxID=1798193 RepID=UPI0006DA98C6|nr:Hsp33 family molecular chaperone HslO [Erythrobacter sp. HL-111]KPP94122.1 MAG: molecular chaperone Hsp33 HslO [Erythrobacteraceae bacterium HL-111]SDS63598.1 molecular chaperone Hsp33 [Erythrobacter sp. HL-111]
MKPARSTSELPETYSDKLLGFTLPGRNARGRVVRLDGVINEVLSAHDYPAPITHLLGEALVLGALMGSLLKDEGGQLTMQAQTQAGVVSLLVCDYRGGSMRGYADFDAEALAGLGANPTLAALFGEGYLAITFETGAGQRYQGIVPLEGDTLAQACETYFSQSEQVPTLIRVASRSSGEGRVAGGLLVQHLPEGEEGRERLHVRMDHPDWEHVLALASTISHEELLDPELSMEAIAWRLFSEDDEIRIQRGADLARGCRCSAEYYAAVLARFPAADQREMQDEEGRIMVDCAFCSRQFAIEV